jgi:LysM repeat protein
MGVVNEPAEVRRAGVAEWVQGLAPILLHPGDAIRYTGVVSAGVTLRLPEGSQVQLMPGASVEAVAYAEADRRLRLRLLSGTVMVETANPFLELETPATVAALRPGSFRVVMQGNDATVTVYRGTVVGTIMGVGTGAPGGAAGVTEVPIGEGEEVRLSQGQAQAVRWQRGPAPTPVPVLTPTPAPTPMPTAGPAQRVHVVEQGDTLLYLGVKYRTTAAAIARANNLADMDTLSIGQKLIIPPSVP